MSDLDIVLDKLNGRSFTARVLLDGNESSVIIEYSATEVEMEIKGLDPGFRLLKNGSVQTYDGTLWQVMDDGQWINILRLMDPRVYSHKVKEGSRKVLPNGHSEVVGSCFIRELGIILNDDYIQWLQDRDAIEREIMFRFDQASELVEFEQSNLPPFRDEKVTVRIYGQNYEATLG